MPGRPPKPSKLLELTGAFRKNPARGRVRQNEPASTGAIGDAPAKFMIFHPDMGYQDAERLRAIWDNCVRMWGQWLEFADRDALEYYCELKLKKDRNKAMSGAEITAMLRICSELGGTGTGRARKGMQGASRPPEKKYADPRAAFLARRRSA